MAGARRSVVHPPSDAAPWTRRIQPSTQKLPAKAQPVEVSVAPVADAVGAAVAEGRNTRFTAAGATPANVLAGELAKNDPIAQREVFGAAVVAEVERARQGPDARPMTVEEALAARRAAPSKAAFYASEPRFDSVQTFVRVSFEGHDLSWYGSVPNDRLPTADNGWQPEPTDLFFQFAYDLMDAELQAKVGNPRERTKGRRENKGEVAIDGPWKPILDVWPSLLEKSRSKPVILNSNVIYQKTLYPNSVLGQLGPMGKTLEFDALFQHEKAQSFLVLHDDGSVQVKQNPGAHFVAKTLGSGEPKVTVYRGESLFSARRVDYLKELSEGVPSSKTVRGLLAALENLEAWLKEETRPTSKFRTEKSELKAIAKVREMIRTHKPPRDIAAVLLRDINPAPYLFTSLADAHASGFAKVGDTRSKYVIDLSRLSPEAAENFHVGADNMLGIELGPRFDTVDHALAAVRALERVGSSAK
ncbi:MAG: hypothetical protein JNK82_24635 [Myxococcaceae bacterium]|nr:hypothetical protein [Myxococcaceae bacterium]